MKSANHICTFALKVFVALSFVSPLTAVAGEESASAEVEVSAHEQGGQRPLNLFDFSSEAREKAAPLAATFINFAILAALVYFIMRKPLNNLFKNRKAEIVKALEEAEIAKTAAEKAIREARAKMESVDKEMAEIRATIIAIGEKEAVRIAASAKAQAERLARDTELLIDQEISRIAETIRGEAVERIVGEATKIIRENITAGDRDMLSRKYLEEINPEAGK
jgi:F0F1-type ATP synthase membrane subunit b/b'